MQVYSVLVVIALILIIMMITINFKESNIVSNNNNTKNNNYLALGPNICMRHYRACAYCAVPCAMILDLISYIYGLDPPQRPGL